MGKYLIIQNKEPNFVAVIKKVSTNDYIGYE